MKRTALYEEHLKNKGKMVPFAGWELPVQFSGILKEHEAVRTTAGVFDVSHMGELLVEGKDSEKFLNTLCTNDVTRLKDYRVLYSPVCYLNGKTVDDVLIYRFSREKYLICTNAANREKDFLWFRENVVGDVKVTDVSHEYSLIALQGPEALKVLKTLGTDDFSKLRAFAFKTCTIGGGRDVLISRTGYTGEDGFEIYLSDEDAPPIWRMLLDAGAVPAGLGARDTLRFEASLPLYGNEINEELSPLEGGLERFVKFNKEDFIGKQALERELEKEDRYVLTGFEMADRKVPRSGYEVFVNGEKAGHVTSGTFSPSTGKSLGMAVLHKKYACEGTLLSVIIRGKPEVAKIIEMPFYTRKRG